MKTIVVTGGGSGGHIAPIRALAPELSKTKNIIWIGSTAFERDAAESLGISFKQIFSGKFRRGLTISNIIKNMIDVVRVEIAGWQSLFFLIKKKPEYIFSTGGFVSVPVVIAGWLLRIPIIIHEQTIGFGFANKIGAFCAQKILLAFLESLDYIDEQYHDKIEIVGNPIRSALLGGNIENLEKYLSSTLDNNKPILYITGGGQGAQAINTIVFESLSELTQKYYVIHQTGSTGIDQGRNQNVRDYFPFEFVGSELADIYASVDIVIARSGAGTVNELDYFEVPSLFIPLRPVQNDEQTKNAEWFLKRNEGLIIHQDEFNRESLLESLNQLEPSELRRNKQAAEKENDSVNKILNILN